MTDIVSEELCKRLDRLECMTVLGHVIDAGGETEVDQVDESYPLRFHLRQLSRYVWFELFNEGKQEQNVVHAVGVVRHAFADYLLACEAGISQKPEAMNSSLASELLTDHWESRRSIRESDADVRISQWCIDTDLTNGLELIEDNWLQDKELWQVDQQWTWAHVYEFLALLMIDAALSCVQRGAPFKAAVIAARASEYHGMATAVRWSQTAETAAISTLGKRGSDVRHSSNRAAKDEAIQLYLSKTCLCP